MPFYESIFSATTISLKGGYVNNDVGVFLWAYGSTIPHVVLVLHGMRTLRPSGSRLGHKLLPEFINPTISIALCHTPANIQSLYYENVANNQSKHVNEEP